MVKKKIKRVEEQEGNFPRKIRVECYTYKGDKLQDIPKLQLKGYRYNIEKSFTPENFDDDDDYDDLPGLDKLQDIPKLQLKGYRYNIEKSFTPENFDDDDDYDDLPGLDKLQDIPKLQLKRYRYNMGNISPDDSSYNVRSPMSDYGKDDIENAGNMSDYGKDDDLPGLEEI